MQDLFTPYKEKRRNSFVSTQNSTLLKMKYCVKNRTQSNQIKKEKERRSSLILSFQFLSYSISHRFNKYNKFAKKKK